MGLLSFFAKDNSHKLFPNKGDIIVEGFSKYENFFPIATLDLSSKGIKDPMHIVYVSFDPAIDDSTIFPKPDYIDEFTFDIVESGKLKPTFNEKALAITDEFRKYFKEGIKKYQKAKKGTKDVNKIIDFVEEPEWWQADQTPINAKGEKYKFICELELSEIIDDDCKMFVFYDKSDRKIKVVYQRT